MRGHSGEIEFSSNSKRKGLGLFLEPEIAKAVGHVKVNGSCFHCLNSSCDWHRGSGLKEESGWSTGTCRGAETWDFAFPSSLLPGAVAGISQFGIRVPTAIPFQALFGEFISY